MLDRRQLLLASTAFAAGWAATACGGDTKSTASSTTAAAKTYPSVPLPDLDPNKKWWLQGNYAPVLKEQNVTNLTVEGTIPSSLTGVYARNGSNPQSGTSTHWFIGDGMVHGVRLDGGKAVWYRNRFIETPLYTKNVDLMSGDGPPGKASTNANVSLQYHAGKLLALGEIGYPYEISTDDMSTVGVFDFAGKLGTNMTAHPRIDPETGKNHFFGYDFAKPYLTYMVADKDGVLEHVAPITIEHSHMIHDFVITKNHAVFWTLPVVFSMDKLSTGLPYTWDPSIPAKVGIIPLGGTNDQMEWFEVEPCMVFHAANAFESADGKVNIDVCRLASAFDGKDLSQASLNELRRWTLTPGTKTAVKEDVRSDTKQDFPSIDRRYVGREHSHSWLTRVTGREGGIGIELSGITHRDEKAGKENVWDPNGRYGPGEVIFVPDSDKAAEGEGWVMTYGYDRTTDKSDLLIFEATDIAAGPVATVHLPVRVPYGFHGTWAPV